VNEISLEAHLGAGRIDSVSVRVRKVDIAERLGGLPCADVVRMLPLLYGVCAKAHGAAAAAALAAARGELTPSVISREVLEEAVRELSLSVFAGPLHPYVREAARKIRNPAELLVTVESALGMPAERWLQLQTLQCWSSGTDSLLAREFRRRSALPEPAAASNLLPVLDAAASLELTSEQLTSNPEWRQRPAETGSVSREWDHPLTQDLAARPLLHRWITRLIELVRYSSMSTTSLLGRVCAVGTEAGHGRATVETARGLLIHDVLTAHGKVVHYRLVAPTDWNFHARGTVQSWLEGAPADSPEAAVDWMRRVCEALDPCMECRVTVGGGAPPYRPRF
jgi:coenzyme F420-reducing hydrogenase alpha subunit